MNSLFSKKSSFTKAIITLLVMTSTTVLGTNFSQKASAFSVCGLTREYASFKTKSYLITVCVGEASFQMNQKSSAPRGGVWKSFARKPLVSIASLYFSPQGAWNYTHTRLKCITMERAINGFLSKRKEKYFEDRMINTIIFWIPDSCLLERTVNHL